MKCLCKWLYNFFEMLFHQSIVFGLKRWYFISQADGIMKGHLSTCTKAHIELQTANA